MGKLGQAAMICALFGASMAFGQNASVSGTITDPSGAQISGAKVSALNTDTGATAPGKSNDSGVYVFPGLQPGKYTFTAEHPGFRKAVISDVVLDIGSQLTVNMGLQLGQASETVEVSATTTPLNASSATVGDVVTGKQLQDLPLTGRSAYNLINTQPGVVFNSGAPNFYLNGNQGNSINYTMDGIGAQNNLLTGSFYNYSNVASVDRVEEVRVVTSPADAEYGRGAGQIQMVTRGGGNTFRGSIYEEHRNTALNANDFFNNSRGVSRAVLILNTYGIRFGGPLKKNKTFFNGIYEPSKSRAKNTFTATSYTALARQGIFRFQPGIQNGNAGAANPSVDFNGNPLNPSTLQSVNVFGLDPNRLVADPTGAVTKNLGLTALPNDFRTVGDGLNTAGYTWNRPVPIDFGLYEGRIDHIINDKHRLALTLNHQAYASINVAAPPPFPNAPWQINPTETTQYSVTLNSVLRPNLINEFKFGVYRPRTTVLTPFNEGEVGPVSHVGILNVKNAVPYVLNFAGGVTSPISGNQSDYINPNYQFGDNTTYIRGKHTFKGGFEVRMISDSGYDANNVVPIVTLGANGALPVSGFSAATFGPNLASAQNLLLDLSGSVATAVQTNYSPGGPNPRFLPGETRFREWHQNEVSFFVKDDFKLRPNITLNLGMRYELYLVPYEGQGKMITPVGGAGAAFGVSGTDSSALFRPGVFTGSTTIIENIGPGTAHPDRSIYNLDKNNIGPAVGFAWSLQGSDRFKWLTGSKDQMAIRAGYGIGYQRLPIYLIHNDSGFLPGFAEQVTSTVATNLSNLSLPVPPTGLPLSTVPTVGPGSHTQSLYTFDPNIRTPYIQNFSFSISRQIAGNTSLNISYVGSKGSKLPRSMDQNEVNVFNNGLLDAFKVIQAGGSSALVDQLFAGFTGAGAPSGSNYVRSTASAARTFFINNNPGGFANYINTTNFGTGLVGGLLANAKLPSNLVVVNPQFSQSYLTGNWGNSTYHSLQVSATRRFGKGFSLQGSYVWSKALGEDDGQSSTYVGTYRSLRNPSLDKTLLSFDRRHVIKINSIYELPFGKGKMIGRNSNGFIDRIIGGWQLGVIYNRATGAPFTVVGQNTFNNTTISAGFTPNLVGELPTAELTKLPGYVTLFPTLTQVADPNRPSLTALAGSPLLSLANSKGDLVFVNATPGNIGTLPLGAFTAPGVHQVDLNIKKRIRFSERFNFELGATATNATNHPVFDAPNAANRNINSTSFGRSTTTSNSPRILVLQGRLNF